MNCTAPYYLIIDLTPLPIGAVVSWNTTGIVTYVQLEDGKIKVTGGNGTITPIITLTNGCVITKDEIVIDSSPCNMSLLVEHVDCIDVDGTFYDSIDISFNNLLGNATILTVHNGATLMHTQSLSPATLFNYQLSEANGDTLTIRVTDTVTQCYQEQTYVLSTCEAGAACLDCTQGTVHSLTNVATGVTGCSGHFDIEMTNVPIGCEWEIVGIRNNSFVPIQYYPIDASGCGFTLTQIAPNSYSVTNTPPGSFIIDWELVGDPTCTQQTTLINLY